MGYSVYRIECQFLDGGAWYAMSEWTSDYAEAQIAQGDKREMGYYTRITERTGMTNDASNEIPF